MTFSVNNSFRIWKSKFEMKISSEEKEEAELKDNLVCTIPFL